MACSTVSTNSPHEQLCTYESCSILKKQESHLTFIVLRSDSVHQAPVSMKKWNKKTQDGNWLATQMTAATSATPPQPAPPIDVSFRRPSGEAIGAQPCKRSRSSRCTEPIGSRPEGLLMAHSKHGCASGTNGYSAGKENEDQMIGKQTRKTMQITENEKSEKQKTVF